MNCLPHIPRIDRLTAWALPLLLITALPVQAQKRNFNWVYGSGIWLHFTPDSLKALMVLDMPPVSARSASISDTTGQFVLVADDHGIRNALLDPVAGGTVAELGWIVPAGNYLVLPLPGHPGHYGVFINELPPGARAGMVEVDMTANGGAGTVVGVTQWYMQGGTAKLAATTDADDEGYWVLHHAEDDDAFHAFHLGPEGLSPSGVVSHAGPVYVATDTVVYTATDSIRYNFFRRGMMNFNFQGDLLATIVNNAAMDSTRLELFHFNRATGGVTHWTGVEGRFLAGPPVPAYCSPAHVLNQPFFRGVDFEPSGRYMYVGLSDSLGSDRSSWLVKFDLEALSDSVAGSASCLISGTGGYYPYPMYDNLYGPTLACAPLGHVYPQHYDLGEGYVLYRMLDGVLDSMLGVGLWGFQVGGPVDVGTALPDLIVPRAPAGFPAPSKRYHDERLSTGLGDLPRPAVAGVYPNPMGNRAVLEIDRAARPQEVVWRNVLGQVLRRDPVGRLGPSFVLERRGLPNGLYLVEVLAKDRSLGVVKVVCE